MMCFWGGDNCTLLLMHKEPLSRGVERAGAQDADTAALGMASFRRSAEEEGERQIRRGGLSPSPFYCVGGCRGKKGAAGLRHLSLAGMVGASGGWEGCRRRERVCRNCSDRF